MSARAPYPSHWIIVGVSFTAMALVYAVWYSFAVFFVALLHEFGWSRSVIAGAFSLFVITHSAAGPFAGAMVDRVGPRKVFLFGSLFLGVGLALSSLTRSGWHFYVSWGMVTAIGVACAGIIPNSTLIQLSFKEKRGLAMGIVFSGIGVGILIFVPLIQYSINQIGWRMTCRIMALVFPVILTAMMIGLWKKKSLPEPAPPSFPEKSVTDRKANHSLVLNKEWVSNCWTVQHALMTKQFWLITIAFFLSTVATQAIFTHNVAFFVDHGLKALSASYLLGIVGIVSIFGKIFWGVLSDRIGRELTYTIGVFMTACGVVALILFTVVSRPFISYLFAVLFGLGYAATATLTPLITADFFEGQSYGRIYGAVMTLNGVGAATGAWFAGFLFDQMGSYVLVFFIVIACALLACLAVWGAAPRKIRLVPGKIAQSTAGAA